MAPPRHGDDDPAPRADLSRLLTVDPTTCPDGEVADAAVALVAVLDQVEAALVRWLAVVDGRTIWLGDGARSAGAWLGARAEISRSAATAKVNMARDLRECPVLATAADAGRIGHAKIRAALQARKAWPDRFAEDEAMLSAMTPTPAPRTRRWGTLIPSAKCRSVSWSDGAA